MFAVFESGGKQHRVAPGDVVRLERLSGGIGDGVAFERVLMVGERSGVSVGAPYLEGARVQGEVVSQGRGRKVRVVKFRRRKNYLRQAGHRQHFTEVRITGIEAADAQGPQASASEAADVRG